MIKYVLFINHEIKQLLLIDVEEQYWGAPRYLYSRSAAVNLGRQEKKKTRDKYYFATSLVP